MRTQIKRTSLRLLQNRLFWIVLVGIVFASNAIWCFRNRVNGDVAWYLYSVMRLRDGAVLYADIRDFNLPLVYLVHLPLAYLSQFLSLPIELLLYAALWSLVAGVVMTIRLTPGLTAIGRRMLLLLAAFAGLSLYRVHLGQRDTVCALLFIPVVCSAWLHRRGETTRSALWWVMLSAAAVSISFKPYFLISWAFVVADLAVHAGLRRAIRMPEVWLPPAFSITSWALTLAIFPNFLAMAGRASRFYGALDGSPWLFLPLALPAMAAVPALLCRNSRLAPFARLCALATAGFVVEALAQKKAFPYHVAPALLWGFLTAGVLVVNALQRSGGSNQFWRASAVAALGSVGLAAYSVWTSMEVPSRPYARTEVDRFVSQYARGKTVLSLSTQPWSAFPLILEARAANARPEAALWAIGGMYANQAAGAGHAARPVVARYHTRAQMSDYERTLFDEVIDGFAKSPPEAIIVEIEPHKWGLRELQFDFLDYFGSDPRFVEALRSYRRGPSDGQRLVLIRAGS